MATKYTLEVYEPGSSMNLWMRWDSTSPFMTIRPGDIINPADWPNAHAPGKVLRVISIEHLIWGGPEEAKQKIMVYNQAVDAADILLTA